MNYLYESICVGYYSVFVFLLFYWIIDDFYLSLLIVGFTKHQLGYWLGLHNYYCNYGDACVKYKSSTNNRYISVKNRLLTESIYESMIYLILGTILSLVITPYKITNLIFIYFILGVILHNLSEKIGLHNYFCNTNCRIV